MVAFFATSFNCVFVAKGERSPRENPTNYHFVAFSPGDLSPRQAKTRDILSLQFVVSLCGWAKGRRAKMRQNSISRVFAFRLRKRTTVKTFYTLEDKIYGCFAN